MTIARKPQSVDEFINGSTLSTESTTPSVESISNIQPVKVRMPMDLLSEIDLHRARKRPKPSRHQFILEALYEKVSRESQNQ